ncbi:G-protein coupled receptor 183-like [Tenrec ecaudatus]|uniref:G-protein coupled receptor 183-like n=1 Tax=Tenrec ecaudatus TaxID=94439 RepID=UPI003F5A1529
MASNETNSTTLCLSHLPPRAASLGLALFYTALLVFSALGNSLALALACPKRERISSTGIYVVHLAVSDLLFTLALPGKITYYTLESSWPFGDGFCRLTAFIFYLNTYGGVYLMTCVSVDRYLAVVRGHRCPQLRQAGRARRVCAIVWALALLQTGPLLFQPMTKTVEGKVTCMEYASVEHTLSLPLWVLLACALSFCGPMGIILFCYVQTTLKLCRTARANPLTSKSGHHRRACLLILGVLVAVVVCFSPYHINLIQFMLRQLLHPSSCAEQEAFKLSLQVTVSLMNMNCCIDPVIYFFACKGYRRWLLSILKFRLAASSSSSGKASSETPNINQTVGSVPLEESKAERILG